MIVLCAKMSIDQIEGTWEEMSCPIVSSSYRSIMSVEGGRKTSTSGMSGVLKNLLTIYYNPFYNCPDQGLSINMYLKFIV